MSKSSTELPFFHPIVARWFKERFGLPSPPQAQGWPAICEAKHSLIVAPTGSGKTLAAFLALINRLLCQGLAGELEDSTQVIYISPLKALGNDIYKNLEAPLAEIRELFQKEGIQVPALRLALRTGDTPAYERRKMLKEAPHILITTPESLHILLTAEKSSQMLTSVKSIIIDEIHAVASEKRGAHLSLSLERLDYRCKRKLQRIGLSATQKPIESMGAILVGNRSKEKRRLEIICCGSHRKMDLRIAVGEEALGALATLSYWESLYERFLSEIKNHRSTIIFCHTRRLVERISHQLSLSLGREAVAAHHGSLSKESRLNAENALKEGRISVIIASLSLELGIDIGDVDLVIHVGAPRSLSSLIQRIGRSGHWKGGQPKGIIFPLTRNELIQAAAAVIATEKEALDEIVAQEKPLDILAQCIVAETAYAEITIRSLWRMVKSSFYYRNLSAQEFREIIEMLSEGYAHARGRSAAWIYYDRVEQLLSARPGARIAAMTSGGAIPEAADYDVIEEPAETLVGQVNEDFAVESMAGDVFLLGNKSWRIRRLEANKVKVVDAQGAAPNIPFWLGEAPARSRELSEALAELLQSIKKVLRAPKEQEKKKQELLLWLSAKAHLSKEGAGQLLCYVQENLQALGDLPAMDTVIAERFFDEAGGTQLIIHSIFGARINRAWGLGLRKRFCLRFDFELQSAATDNALLFSLGEGHSFPLESIFALLGSNGLRKDILHSLLPLPLFRNRFRWNAGRSLAVLRFSQGRRVPIHIQRMRTEDLLASIFPAHTGCQDNRSGPIEPVDHPLINETISNCLEEAMDIKGLEQLIHAIESAKLICKTLERPSPSPFAQEILHANPYAFLDDAPIEERRSRAISMKSISPQLGLDVAAGSGALSPFAIAQAAQAAWPKICSPRALSDLLFSLFLLPIECSASSERHYNWRPYIAELRKKKRITKLSWQDEEGAMRQAYAPIERMGALRKIFPKLQAQPELQCSVQEQALERKEALTKLVGSWMEILGPMQIPALAQLLGLKQSDISYAMAALEQEGRVNYLSGAPKKHSKDSSAQDKGGEWCNRKLLAHIHRISLTKLRREIEAISPADYMQFLFQWQHVYRSTTALHGKEGLLTHIEQMQGLALSPEYWEEHIFKRRIQDYKREDLDELCQQGKIAWRSCQKIPSAKEMREKTWKRYAFGHIFRTHKRNKSMKLSFYLRRDRDIYFTREKERDFSKKAEHKETEDAAWLRLSPHLRQEEQKLCADIIYYLADKGASFFRDLLEHFQVMPGELEEALRILLLSGKLSSDSFMVISMLFCTRHARSLPGRNGILSGNHSIHRWENESRELPGRFYLHPAPLNPEEATEETIEKAALQLLKRYGILIREALAKEAFLPPWWKLLSALRRLEMRGLIRGGRFVKGFSGEQFALPEAVESLRSCRRQRDPMQTERVLLPIADPLNLSSINTSKAFTRKRSKDWVLYENGKLQHIGNLGEIRSLIGRQEEYVSLLRKLS